MKLRFFFSVPALVCLSFVPVRGTRAQDISSGAPTAQTTSQDQPALPIFAGQQIELLTPQPLPVGPCPVSLAQSRSEIRERMRKKHVDQIRASIQAMKADKKHGVHVYLANQSQLRGRVVRIGEDSFVLKVAKNKPDVNVAFSNVSWVTKEPNGPEKFRHGAAMTGVFILAAPILLPILLLWWASGAD